MKDGRQEEGMELLRNAVVAGSLDEIEDGTSEMCALELLTRAVVKTQGWEELEQLVPRFREVLIRSRAKSTSRHVDRACNFELSGFYLDALLHEVPFPSVGCRC